MEADDPDSGATAYGSTLQRLQSVKAQWDPGNVFRLNQNIVPAAAS